MTLPLPESGPPADLLAQIEALAVELAQLGGREIESGMGRELAVEYKTEARGHAAPRDPVSEVDRAVEELVRDQLARHFPEHGVIGEEMDVQPREADEYLWVIDPVDGTSNFVNGFPFVACSIGVLHRGVPVAGAIWCSSSPLLRPGAYHAHLGGLLNFEGVPIERSARPGLRRRLAAAPGGSSAAARGWDHRVTGSAAIECAFVAAGTFNSAMFFGPAIWDVAAGIALVRAAGLEVLERAPGRGGAWLPFQGFRAPARVKADRAPTLRDWRRPLLIGEGEPVQERLEAMRSRGGLRLPWRRGRR